MTAPFGRRDRLRVATAWPIVVPGGARLQRAVPPWGAPGGTSGAGPAETMRCLWVSVLVSVPTPTPVWPCLSVISWSSSLVLFLSVQSSEAWPNTTPQWPPCSPPAPASSAPPLLWPPGQLGTRVFQRVPLSPLPTPPGATDKGKQVLIPMLLKQRTFAPTPGVSKPS